MKKLLFFPACFIVSIILVNTASAQGMLGRLKQKVKDKVEQRVDQKEDKAIDKTLDGIENGSKSDQTASTNNTNDKNTGSTNPTVSEDNQYTVKTYQNYDFVPGDTILFADDFTQDQDGEFPAHWNLEKGQAVVNKVMNTPAFFLTEGNYCQVYPLIKKQSYLTDPFTIEFDYYAQGGSYGPVLFLKFKNKDGNEETADVHFSQRGEVSTGYFPHDFSHNYPNEDDATFFNKWHHCAMIYKNNQLKCYVDQNRILVMPNADIVPYAFGFGGIGDDKNPIIFTNVRVASGGNMNMIGKKFTEAKIVTHGITFDIDKADIKPESMGTLNMIAGILKNNPDLKFEIDGHTDNSGEAQHNLDLSQRRAEAVKTQLVSMGIDASRLSTKGFGDTKPISSNDTPEGKANNRRVEFVKM